MSSPTGPAPVISTRSPGTAPEMFTVCSAIAVGSDADIVIYDPKREHTISAKTHHMAVDYSCYEGRTVQGGSDIVMSRGSVIVRNGDFTGKQGAGRFLKRAAASYARLA